MASSDSSSNNEVAAAFDFLARTEPHELLKMPDPRHTPTPPVQKDEVAYHVPELDSPTFVVAEDVEATDNTTSNGRVASPLPPPENGIASLVVVRSGDLETPKTPVSVRSNSSTTFSFPGGPQSSLLRLFQSEMFDSRLCLHYLQRYADSVGVQHYLSTKALPFFPMQEIEFLLPQLLHLLIVRGPEKGHELENFLVRCCEQHHHISLMVLWLLQGYIWDFRNEQSKVSERGRYVAKLYQKVQTLMFPAATAAATANQGPSIPILRKISTPSVGMANGIPKLVTSSAVSGSSAPGVGGSTASSSTLSSSKVVKRGNVAPMLVGIGSILGSIGLPALAEVTKDIVLSQNSLLGLQDTDVFPAGDGLLEQSRAIVLSAPSASGARASSRTSISELPSPVRAIPTLEALSQGAAFITGESVGPETYFHSTLKFFTTLTQISDRLRIVPRHARQSSLQAELELLNHNLPADVCIPMWCPAKGRGETVWHHKIVAVAANDSVVLNSAERVPYLLLIEVFEPNEKAIEEAEARMSMDTEGRKSESPADDASSCEDCKRLRDDFLKGFTDGTMKVQSRYKGSNLVESSLSPVSETSGANGSPSINVEHAEERNSEEESLMSSAKANEGAQKDSSPTHPALSPHSEALIKISQITCPRHSYYSKPSAGSNSAFFNREYYRSVLDRRLRNPGASSASLLPTSTSFQQHQANMLAPEDATHAARMRHIHIHDEFTEKMKTAAIMLAQLYQQQAATVSQNPDQADPAHFDIIRNRIIKEMMSLEDTRRKRLDETKSTVSFDVDETLEEGLERRLREEFQSRPDDPSAVVLKEPFHLKKARIRAMSRYGNDPRWNLLPAIVKSGADLRQEQLASQLLKEFRDIWRKRNVRCWVKYYRVLPTSEQSGLVETVVDTISIHSLKKDAYARKLNQQGLQYSCYDWFVREFGQPGCDAFQSAQDNFMRSLAGYSLLCYVLNIKDRHNGNILVDRHGHLIHIDYGFMLANTPGSVGFEMAPFKLTQEYVDVLGGTHSEKFREFKALLKDGLIALRTEMDRIITLVELVEKDSTLPCFTGRTPKPLPPGAVVPPPTTSTGSIFASLKERFHEGLIDKEVEALVDRLVAAAHNNIFTRLYDSFQYYLQGLMP